MEIYRGSIDLLDYVFYATVERGKVYETGAFIHNYALAYALGLPRGETYVYARRTQEPHYQEELTPLNGLVYLTPGQPVQFSHRLVQWNTLREAYAFPGKPPSLGYPDWGFARMLRPGSRFCFYLLLGNQDSATGAPALADLLAGRPVRVRLGKFPAKARLLLEAATSVVERTGPFVSEPLLNWRDLKSDPVVCDILASSLPTRLISRASFDSGSYYEARFGDDIVHLPAGMHFLARAPQTAGRKRRA